MATCAAPLLALVLALLPLPAAASGGSLAGSCVAGASSPPAATSAEPGGVDADSEDEVQLLRCQLLQTALSHAAAEPSSFAPTSSGGLAATTRAAQLLPSPKSNITVAALAVAAARDLPVATGQPNNENHVESVHFSAANGSLAEQAADSAAATKAEATVHLDASGTPLLAAAAGALLAAGPGRGLAASRSHAQGLLVGAGDGGPPSQPHASAGLSVAEVEAVVAVQDDPLADLPFHGALAYTLTAAAAAYLVLACVRTWSVAHMNAIECQEARETLEGLSFFAGEGTPASRSSSFRKMASIEKFFAAEAAAKAPAEPLGEVAARDFDWATVAVLLTEALDSLCAMAVVPTMPFYLRDIGASDMEITWMRSGFAVAQAFCVLVFGSLSDHFSRKQLLLFLLVLSSCANFAQGFCVSFRSLLVARLLMGVACAKDPVLTSYIVDHAAPGARERVLAAQMAVRSACFAGGIMFGSVVYGLAGWQGLSFLLGGICLLQAALGAHLWADDAPAKASGESLLLRGFSQFLVMRHWAHPVIGKLLVYGLLVNFGLQLQLACWPLFLADRYGFDAAAFGTWLSAYGVLTSLTAGLSGPLKKGLGASATMALFCATMVLTNGWLVAGTALAGSPWVALLAAPLFAPQAILGTEWLSWMVNENERGEVFALMFALSAASSVAAPAAAGALYGLRSGAPLALAAAAFGLGLVLVRCIPRSQGF